MNWKPPPLPVRLPMTDPLREFFDTKRGRPYKRYYKRCDLMTSDGYPCGHQRKSLCTMSEHVQMHHSLMDCPVDGCPQTGLYDIWALTMHYKLNHQDYIRCSVCNHGCQSWQSFQDHARSENCRDKLGVLVCHFCDALSLNEDMFCLHLLEEHVKVPEPIIEEEDILQLLREAKEARPPANPEGEDGVGANQEGEDGVGANQEGEAEANPEEETPYWPKLDWFNTNLIPIRHPNIRMIFDTRIKQPLLVEHTLTQANLDPSTLTLSTNFSYDPTISKDVQLSPSKKIAGYHHGHGAEKSLHSSSPESRRVANFMTNCVMQREKYNTRVNSKTEKATRKMIGRNAQVKASGGPSFSTNTVIEDVRIADTFWKLLTGKDENGIIREQIGWIISHNFPENGDIASCVKTREEIEDFIDYRLTAHH